jgi:hypothetical protein
MDRTAMRLGSMQRLKMCNSGDDNAGAMPVVIKVRENHEIFGVFRT